MPMTAPAWRKDDGPDLSGGRPERDADANLRRPLAHRVGEHSVDAKRGERKRDDRECRHEHEGEALPARAAFHDFCHRRRPMHHQLGIESRHFPAHVTHQLLRHPLGGDDLRQRPVPVAGELTMGVVDDHRRRAVDIEGDVADDPDDLELLAAGGNPLSENALERQARKRHPGEVGADDRLVGASASSRASKFRPASMGIPNAAKRLPLTTRCCIEKRLRSSGVPASGPVRIWVFHG